MQSVALYGPQIGITQLNDTDLFSSLFFMQLHGEGTDRVFYRRCDR